MRIGIFSAKFSLLNIVFITRHFVRVFSMTAKPKHERESLAYGLSPLAANVEMHLE